MKNSTLSFAVFSSITSVNAVMAQDVNTAADFDTPIYLAPIVVSAQHRDQLAVDVPISVTAIQEPELEARQVSRILDVANNTPNTFATVQRGGNDSTSLVIRGVGSTAFGAPPSVAVYVDGVYVGADGGFSANIPDLEHVEILRGPQGTLAGRNALAGSITLETADPELGVTQSDVSLTYGSNNFRSGAFTQNWAVNDDVALRFSIQRTQDDGTVPNQQGGEDLDSEDTTAARLKLLYNPTENWEALLSFDYAKDEGRPAAFGPIATVLESGVNSAQPFGEKVENSGVSLQNTWQTSLGQLESITAWRSTESELLPGTFAAVAVDLGFGERDYSQFTQEFLLTGERGRTFWTLGAFFLSSKDERQEGLTLATSAFGLPAGYEEVSDSVVDTTSIALFADGTHALTDTLDLVAGIRLSYDRSEIDYVHSGNLGYSVLALSQTVNDSVTTRSVSPRIGLNWAVNPQTKLYGTISSATKPAGFNISFANSTDLSYEDETGINYEIGAKGTAWGGDLSYAVSAFYLDWRNQQVLTVDSETNAILINNAERSRSFGLEAQADARLAENTLLQVGFGYNDATFVDFSNAPNGDASGLQQPLAPEYSASLGLEHTIAMGRGDLILRGYYNWRSSFFFDASNLIEQSSYGLLDLSVTYDAGDWTARLYVDNALDKDYLFSGANVPLQGGLLGYPGEGRTIGLALTATF